MHTTDHIQIVTFRLDGIAPDDYGARAEALAPTFAALPGLRSKLWLADPATGTYGGVYAWRDRAALLAYRDGPLFGAVRDDPGFAGVASREFALLEQPTRVTAGGG